MRRIVTGVIYVLAFGAVIILSYLVAIALMALRNLKSR